MNATERTRAAALLDKSLPTHRQAYSDRTAFGGYLHGGDMRYLTNCAPGTYGQVRLLFAVGLFRRLYGFGVKKWPLRKFLKDHSISVYRRKLMVVAETRS